MSYCYNFIEYGVGQSVEERRHTQWLNNSECLRAQLQLVCDNATENWNIIFSIITKTKAVLIVSL